MTQLNAMTSRFGFGSATATLSFSILGATGTITVQLSRAYADPAWAALAQITAASSVGVLGGVVVVQEVRQNGLDKVDVVVKSSAVLASVTVAVEVVSIRTT